MAIDPEPAPELVELAERRPELELIRGTSPEALSEALPAGAIILDGDHNYWTLSGELRAIAERSDGGELPLLILHDIGWPHSRRDTYYAPERVPEEHRQPLAQDALLTPGNPGTASEGVRFEWAAAREGGPENGILTAVEDFVREREGLRLAVVPAFFGLGVLWAEDAPWAAAAAGILDPWDAAPMLERLEEVRIAQVVNRTRMNRQQELLRNMLNSRAFTIAESIAADPRREQSAVLARADQARSGRLAVGRFAAVAPPGRHHSVAQAPVGGVSGMADPSRELSEPAERGGPAPALAALNLVEVLGEPGDVVLGETQLDAHRLELRLGATGPLLPVDVPSSEKLPSHFSAILMWAATQAS